MKYKKKSYFLLIIILFLCLFTPNSYAAARTVRVGYYLFDSFQEIDEYGEYSGYGFEYISEISQYNGWNLEFKVGTMAECEELMKNGEVDIILGVTPTSSRSAYMDFSDFACTTSQSELYVSASSDQYAYEDFNSFHGMTVGVIKGNSLISLLDDYCEENHFSIQKVEFNSQTEMEQALSDGTVDAVFSSNISNFSDNKIVARFPEISLYFGIRKGADDILKELNKAVKDITENNPFFMTELGNRYLIRGQTNNPAFTREELDYINSKKDVICIYDPSWAPLEYYDEKTGEIKGINPDIFKLISNYTGLTIHYEPSLSFTEALEKIDDQTVDIISCIYHDYNWAQTNNLYITSSYLKFPVVMVTRPSNGSIEHPVIALPKSHYTSIQVERQLADATFVYCDTIEECFEMLRTKKADSTYVNLYVANHFLSDYKYYNLSMVFLANFQEEISLGISKNSNPLLLSIINKALSCISEDTISNIVFKNTIDRKTLTFRDIVYGNPIQIIFYLVILFFIILGTFLYILISKEKNNKKINAFLNQSKLDNYRLNLAMQHILCQIFEYDMNENTITILDNENNSKRLFLAPGIHSIAEVSHILPEFHDNYFQMFHEIEAGQPSAEGTILAASTNGENCWYQISMTAVTDNAGNSLQAIGTIEDITDEKLKTEFDFLTGLYTRGNAEKYIRRRLEQVAVFYDQSQIIDALFLLDLDHFKAVNDTYGHTEGDALLKQIGCILSDCVQSADIAGRLGGDEFILYFQNLSDEYDALLKAQEICDYIINASKQKTEWASITVSIGIAYSPRNGSSFEKLYENADKALYCSKENGRNQYSVYTET